MNNHIKLGKDGWNEERTVDPHISIIGGKNASGTILLEIIYWQVSCFFQSKYFLEALSLLVSLYLVLSFLRHACVLELANTSTAATALWTSGVLIMRNFWKPVRADLVGKLPSGVVPKQCRCRYSCNLASEPEVLGISTVCVPKGPKPGPDVWCLCVRKEFFPVGTVRHEEGIQYRVSDLIRLENSFTRWNGKKWPRKWSKQDKKYPPGVIS